MDRRPGDLRCSMPGRDPASGSGAQRMYSSSASYSVNSMFDVTSVMPSAWNAGKSCSADHRSWCALDSHGHHVEPAGVRAGRPGEQSVDVLGRVVLGGDRAEAVDRYPRRRRDVDVCHGYPAFPKFVLAGRTLRESPGPAIGGITHWSTHSPSAWVLRHGSRRALRWPRRRSGCGSEARAWSGCAGRGSRPSARRRRGSGRSACSSVPARPAGPPRSRGG
jgi:hypothetical protein